MNVSDSSESGSKSGRDGGRGGGSTKVSSDGKPTRVRTVLNEKQLHTLRTCYNANPRPDALMKEQLVEMTGLSPRVIRVWFQNKRCKDKKRAIAMKQQLQQEKSTSPTSESQVYSYSTAVTAMVTILNIKRPRFVVGNSKSKGILNTKRLHTIQRFYYPHPTLRILEIFSKVSANHVLTHFY
ncbi:Insulin protein enhancer protein isl-1 [Homalodisca vitripennis]|nr:Insulin protein enhancer protein isl-1 [Homalodisca vitripennis]